MASIVKVANFKHCPECGDKYLVHTDKLVEIHCKNCDHFHFFNKISVATLIIPDLSFSSVWMQLRGGDNGAGKWSLPGGYTQRGESIRQSFAREAEEEVNVRVLDPEKNIRVVDAHSSRRLNQDLVIGIADPRFVEVGDFTPNDETIERRLCNPISAGLEIAFPVHLFALQTFFAGGYN